MLRRDCFLPDDDDDAEPVWTTMRTTTCGGVFSESLSNFFTLRVVPVNIRIYPPTKSPSWGTRGEKRDMHSRSAESAVISPRDTRYHVQEIRTARSTFCASFPSPLPAAAHVGEIETSVTVHTHGHMRVWRSILRPKWRRCGRRRPDRRGRRRGRGGECVVLGVRWRRRTRVWWRRAMYSGGLGNEGDAGGEVARKHELRTPEEGGASGGPGVTGRDEDVPHLHLFLPAILRTFPRSSDTCVFKTTPGKWCLWRGDLDKRGRVHADADDIEKVAEGREEMDWTGLEALKVHLPRAKGRGKRMNECREGGIRVVGTGRG
ncbi:hypothetical protein R3P38DRAFT_2794067 [Favolaschia claudopus]|uniref:Uncharacterized protein n=1 Tax=Favolaschia claudopus TaxID=2862362 RepID=A0AAW0ABE6_9AGAR